MLLIVNNTIAKQYICIFIVALKKLNNMKRKEFLKNVAFTGVLASILPTTQSCKKDSTSNGDCTETPSEVAGPFPTHNPETLVLQDITSDREGTPLTIEIAIKNINNNCATLEGAIVDIWHCDSNGEYSEYGNTPMQTADHTSEHFLRGRQTTNANGMVGFTSLYPGWYSGRAPHIHVQIFNSSGTSLLITQIAFPESVSSTVYSQGVYAANGQADTSNATDNIFNDSIANELATLTGNTTDGYTLSHSIYVKA